MQVSALRSELHCKTFPLMIKTTTTKKLNLATTVQNKSEKFSFFFYREWVYYLTTFQIISTQRHSGCLHRLQAPAPSVSVSSILNGLISFISSCAAYHSLYLSQWERYQYISPSGYLLSPESYIFHIS